MVIRIYITQIYCEDYWDLAHGSACNLGCHDCWLESEPLHQFSSVQSLSRVWLFVTTWTAAHQASLSIKNSQSLLKLMSIESVMPSNHLIHCCPLLLPPSIFPTTHDPMDWSTWGFPVPHQLLEVTQNSHPSSWWCHPTISDRKSVV